ncbi:toll/interleukin-1 receptor domain-containing protein [Sphingopyxis sp.]|uniref:toll/interleukin-1 receptor domain-containing protein n=1 Tax=Sphingopyxis sp. TaxID=1908224 RepID=UPI0010F86382|nr:toll/interleukin-1 receptor domain-containing protein [Sphingopyxis sp.]MBR2175107.1 toll/interleukin-1 receptor domain-containing protein [Sphingopyxis sp.]
MTDVFISYKREERGRCVAIYNALIDLKLSVWFDAHIEPGTDFDREIEREVRRAKAVLVLWSELAADSDWIRAEARTGRQSERLVAARLDDCLPPLEFASVQAVDLFDRPDFQAGDGWRQIVARIGRLVGRAGLGDYVRCEQSADAEQWRGWIADNAGDPLLGKARERLAALAGTKVAGTTSPVADRPEITAAATDIAPDRLGHVAAFVRRHRLIALGAIGVALLVWAASAYWSGQPVRAPVDSEASARGEVPSGPPPAVVSDMTEAFVPKDLGSAVCNTGPYPIAFDSGMAAITPDSRGMLDMLGKVARDCGGGIEIAGPNDRMTAVVQNYLEARGVAPRNVTRRTSAATGSSVEITLR